MAPGVSAGAVAAAVASMGRISSDGLRAAIELLPTHDVRGRLGELRAPTLVLVGELDEETPLAYAEVLAGGIRARAWRSSRAPGTSPTSRRPRR